jgi:hypothetical protein
MRIARKNFLARYSSQSAASFMGYLDLDENTCRVNLLLYQVDTAAPAENAFRFLLKSMPF